MNDHQPAFHVQLFYWSVLLIDVTSLRLGRALDRICARRWRSEAARPASPVEADRTKANGIAGLEVRVAR